MYLSDGIYGIFLFLLKPLIEDMRECDMAHRMSVVCCLDICKLSKNGRTGVVDLIIEDNIN